MLLSAEAYRESLDRYKPRVFVDGVRFATLQGSYEELAGRFLALVDDYVATRYPRREGGPRRLLLVGLGKRLLSDGLNLKLIRDHFGI